MSKAKPRLSLCMVVRDEEGDLPRALGSVQELVDEIIVVDTGSVDDSRQIARSFGAKVYDHPWQDDFSAPKNLALEKARGKWVLILDADEELLAEDREKIRQAVGSPGDAEGYLFSLVNYTGETPGAQYELTLNLRLFRNRPGYRFSRPVHEQLSELKPGNKLVSRPDIRILHYGYLEPYLVRKQKRERNFSILQRRVGAGQADSFDYFNLGVEYNRQNRWQEALIALQLARKLQSGGPMWLSACCRVQIQCLLQLQAWDEALQETEVSLEVYPDYADLVYLRGIALAGKGQYPQALGAFYQAAALEGLVPHGYARDPGLTSYKAHYSIAQAYLQLGQRDEAVSALRKALKQEAGYRPALLSLARCLAGNGEGELAKLESLIEGGGEERYLTLAEICHEAGLLKIAQEFLSRYRGQLPPDYIFLQGILHWKTGAYREAAAALGLCGPDHHRAREATLLSWGCRWLLGEVPDPDRELKELGCSQADCDFLVRLFLDEADRALQQSEQDFPGVPVLANYRARLDHCRQLVCQGDRSLDTN